MKKRMVREAGEERFGKKSIPMTGFLVFILTGYLLFFTSRLWIPDNGKLQKATPYYQKEIYETYDMYLTQWKYDDAADRMQVIVELENKEVLDGKLEFGAVERKKGELNIKVMYQDAEFAVLQIYEIPKDWKEISLRAGQKDAGSPAKFYTNADEVERERIAENETEADCIRERLQAQVAYDDIRISEKEKKIKGYQGENRKLAEKIEALKKETYPSEEESEKAGDTILKAENQIASNENQIAVLKEEIGALENRTENIKKQMEELQQK